MRIGASPVPAQRQWAGEKGAGKENTRRRADGDRHLGAWHPCCCGGGGDALRANAGVVPLHARERACGRTIPSLDRDECNARERARDKTCPGARPQAIWPSSQQALAFRPRNISRTPGRQCRMTWNRTYAHAVHAHADQCMHTRLHGCIICIRRCTRRFITACLHTSVHTQIH